MPEFCDGVTSWESAEQCPKYTTNKPCYSCKVAQWQSEGRAPGLPPSKRTTPMKGTASSNAEYNKWEAGFVYEDRPGGVKAPIYNDKGKPIRNKEYSENRHQITERRKREISNG